MRPLLALLLIASPVMAAPVEQGAPNVPEFKPAFAGQTRADAVKTRGNVRVAEIAAGLNKPWGVALLPGGKFLVSEKAGGTLRIIGADGSKSPPLTGTPKVDARDQGGMMGVSVPGDGWVYFSYAEPRDGGSGLVVARGKLGGTDAAPALTEVKTIFSMQPTIDSTKHFGGRMVFLPNNMMYITLGERSIVPGRVQAQDPGSHFGKIVRIGRDGSVPKDNPLVGRAGAKPEIWSWGHRNVLSAALDSRGRLWEVEMGPKGGDELNLVAKGKDYGWPTITYGEEYSGKPIGQAITQKAGMEQPVYYWDPVISPSGMAIHSGRGATEWQGNVFIGGLSSKALVRLVLNGDRVVGEERLLTDRGERIRDVVEGPAGELYVLTDDANGKLLKVTVGN
ncbi:glucose dehydrogenase [Polymorphobacter multimanifer]|uniref:Glucose/arabinose dehydrogenase n=1 Tax=Polymorphobacter multimanifer TaxID=1070431 RepID=A0A841KZP5_9SPHN|nr:PQQ-dependent sugar dehydrogenase [Polymorphobacter multimanifer]MBB6225887.1 glucose/arabinose dehydrogenase [Polymorphobacter multimanifer]GGI74450.1 glucose dehydrogenase [Polymorphobacter multimanifer]